MKVAVHASHLCQEREDGNQTYILNLFRNLAKVDVTNQYDFYYSQTHCKAIEASNFHQKVAAGNNWAWTQRVFPRLLRRDKPDLLFMPIQMLPLLTPRDQKTVVTIHDLAFLFYPETFPLKDVILHKIYVRKAIMAADHLIAITQATKDDITRIYKVPEDKITVVYHGIDRERFHPMKKKDQIKVEEVKQKYHITKPYLIYVGNVQPRKNIQGLIKAFHLLKQEGYPDMQLVVAGAKAWLVDQVMQELDGRATDDIIFTGRFLDGELAPLLWGAKLFVLPSFYEGFGLPILEAAACGVPVLVANTPSLVEVGGKASLSFDPHDPQDMKQVIQQVWDDDKLRRSMIQRGYERVEEFSWERCAKETLQVLESIGYEKTI